MIRLVVLLLVVLGGCTPRAPSSTPEAAPTVQPGSPPRATPAPLSGRFLIHVDSPFPATIALHPGGDVRLTWVGGEIAFRPDAPTLASLTEKAAAARKAMGGPKTDATLFYEGPEGALSGTGPEVEPLRQALEALVPTQGLGPGGAWAVGKLEKSDLEGGFYQLGLADQNLVLSGKIAPEMVGRQVLVTGRLDPEQVGIGMTGPIYTVEEARPWPPELGK